jgi:hypothetical protein
LNDFFSNGLGWHFMDIGSFKELDIEPFEQPSVIDTVNLQTGHRCTSGFAPDLPPAENTALLVFLREKRGEIK